MARLSTDVGTKLLELLKATSGELLIQTLRSIDGKKDLVIEQDLIFPLDHIAGVSLIKTSGVEKIYKLEPRSPPSQNNKCVYLVRSTIANMKTISDHINHNKQLNKDCRYFIVCIPKKVPVCELLLEQEGVYGFVNFLEFPLGLLPLDTDLFSLELPEFFPSYFLDNDSSWVYTVAQSLVQLERLLGPIAHIYGQGNCVHDVLSVMKILNADTGQAQKPQPKITHLFLFDRDIDYASVLLTQLTYGGLLDETFGIKSGRVTFGKEVTGKDQEIKLPVNSSEMVYKEIRDRHFSNVFSFLKEKAQHLQSKYDERHGMSIGDMKKFVANELKSLQQQHNSLALHIGACEVIMKQKNKGSFEEHLRTEHNLLEGSDIRECTNYVEECINRQYLMLSTLRLLCLYSVSQDGISSQQYKSLMVQFLHSYGYEHLSTFHNLKKLGLYHEQGTAVNLAINAPKLASKMAAAMASLPRSSQFNMITRRLALIPKADDSYDLKNPKDLGYIFSGAYIPVSCKFVEQVMQRDGIQGLEETFKVLPGTTTNLSNRHMKGNSASSPYPVSAPKVILVYFLGGVTFAEVSALRLLGRLRGYQVIIATTALINGNTFLQQILPKKPS